MVLLRDLMLEIQVYLTLVELKKENMDYNVDHILKRFNVMRPANLSRAIESYVE